MGDLKVDKCGNDECKTKFTENFIIYKCEDCEKFYCYSCFCKHHFEIHKKSVKWLEYRIINGKVELTRDPYDPPK